MKVEDFKEWCKDNDYNILESWDFKRFNITCRCGSEHIQVGHRTKETFQGSSLTGAWTSQEEAMLVKCLDCGLAMTIIGDLDD